MNGAVNGAMNSAVNKRANWSRLELVGEYAAQSPIRIGSGAPDGGLALDPGGHFFIPATSFRGALRAYIESVLRGMDSEAMTTLHYLLVTGDAGTPTPIIRRVCLCCDSVDKRQDDPSYDGCLTQAIVTRWRADPVLRPQFEQALIDCTCPVCRLFGAPWLAGRVIVSDLTLIDQTWNETSAVRGGMPVQRDTEVGKVHDAYSRKAIPAGARFRFRLLVENASFAEQGMILLGLRAFEMGLVALGADRSRGMGRGRLEIDWWNCRYLDVDNLIGALLTTEPAPFTELDADIRISALADLLNDLSRRA